MVDSGSGPQPPGRRADGTHQPLPLADVTVLACEQAVAAPLATRQLADLGARVIKVERPGGGDFARAYDTVMAGQSSAFVWLNRGKESVQLDLKRTDDLAALHRMLGRVDVFVANLAPSALATFGLDATALHERYPALVACQISGYPQTGPAPGKKAYDALVQAEAGVMSLTGSAGAPAKVGISIADIAAGSYAFSGILAALRHRDRLGAALPVRVSLFDALTEWMAYPLYYTQHSGRAPAPMGTAHPTIAPYGAYTAADGVSVMIAVQHDREWLRLCTEVLDAPDLAADERFSTNSLRVANRDALEPALSACFAGHSRQELVRRLDAAGIAWGRLTELADLAGHPELAGEQRWCDTGTPGGPVRTLRPPGTPGGETVLDAAVPALGEHTEAVLTEFAE